MSRLIWNLASQAVEKKKKKTPAKKAPAKKKKVETPPIIAEEQKLMPGLYLDDAGVLLLTGEFDHKNIMPLVGKIMEYNLMPEELQPKRLTMIINSPGGQIAPCLTLIDTMLTSSIPVDTFATGMAASCGIMTLMAGEHRMASVSCQLMSHQYSAGSTGKEHELFGRVKSFEQTSDWMLRHYSYCTGLSSKKIKKRLLGPTDMWLDPQEALSYNIIDEVINVYGEKPSKDE